MYEKVLTNNFDAIISSGVISTSILDHQLGFNIGQMEKQADHDLTDFQSITLQA